MIRKILLLCAAGLTLAACSASDLAYLTETGTYPDQTLPDDHMDCPTGTVIVRSGIRDGQAYQYAINNTRQRIGINFNSRFGGGNQYYADPGERTDTLYRSPVDANGAAYQLQCDASG